MGQILRWWIAGLVVAATFAVTTWAGGAYVLPLVMKSSSDRWVIAAGVGVAIAALAGLWGQSWATRESSPASAPPSKPSDATGNRTISAHGNIIGIASTGDNTTNTQHK